MEKAENQGNFLCKLTDEDQEHIRIIFHECITPKLIKLDARLGILNCKFAGERYQNWNVQFKSVGSDFDIVDFEYDEEGCGIDLDI
ncbi:MAG: hypothetical protein SV375_08370 [Thermodesulfobacteriota bacterium]|nr:hypothetical protein [Thermodesulfobacteriota bacterium]